MKKLLIATVAAAVIASASSLESYINKNVNYINSKIQTLQEQKAKIKKEINEKYSDIENLQEELSLYDDKINSLQVFENYIQNAASLSEAKIYVKKAKAVISNKAPYSLRKFRSVLDKVKFQAPTSSKSKYSIAQGNFEGAYNKYFYLKDNKYMTFKMCDKSHRSELREMQDWKVSTHTPKIMTAVVKLNPDSEKKEFTFLQIHDDANANPNGLNKPLLRIAWYKSFEGRSKHIWAFIKVLDDSGMWTKKVDLGKAPKGFFNVKVFVKDSKMKIFINNKEYDFDVSYWNDYLNYFKAGVYLQGDGCAKAYFDRLEFK